jgi:hypothetical protein
MGLAGGVVFVEDKTIGEEPAEVVGSLLESTNHTPEDSKSPTTTDVPG